MASGATRRFINHTGTAQSDFGGPIALGAGATIDWVLSRVAANLASLADGDSLRITDGSLFFGTAGSVNLSEGAANRLDLASGDSFRIVLGALEFAGAAESISRAAGLLQFNAATRHDFNAPVGLQTFTVATLPAVSPAGQLIHVSDETGGAVAAYSDGTNWRRFSDGAIVA